MKLFAAFSFFAVLSAAGPDDAASQIDKLACLKPNEFAKKMESYNLLLMEKGYTPQQIFHKSKSIHTSVKQRQRELGCSDDNDFDILGSRSDQLATTSSSLTSDKTNIKPKATLTTSEKLEKQRRLKALKDSTTAKMEQDKAASGDKLSPEQEAYYNDIFTNIKKLSVKIASS